VFPTKTIQLNKKELLLRPPIHTDKPLCPTESKVPINKKEDEEEGLT